MISYQATVTSSAAKDLFNGSGSTGKWIVQVEVSVASGAAYLSVDGTTQGQRLYNTGLNRNGYQFILEDQPLYVISTGTTILDVTITPVVEPTITLGLCS